MAHEISPALAAQAAHQLQHPELKKTLNQLIDASPHSPVSISTALHPACQMLGHSLRVHQDAALSVSQYFSVALQQYAVATEVIERLADQCPQPRILDFACGYGRLLNLLTQQIPVERIWASEIQPEAVQFVVDQFGVQGLQSSADPDQFDPGQTFDLIWVVSLFSHLPPGLFERWLQRLSELLSPGGILLFSVHDEALLTAADPVLPESGVLYIEGSENDALDKAIYGTTFVSESFVQRAIASTLGADRHYLRCPRLINHEQDAYLIGGPANPDLSAFQAIPRGLRGWVDELAIDDHGQLSLAGWAGSMDAEEAVELEILLDDQPQDCTLGEPKPEVARVLGLPHLVDSGWSARLQLPGDGEEAYLTVLVRNRHGRRALIYAGAVQCTDRAGGQ